MRAHVLSAVVVLCGALAGWFVGALVPSALTDGSLELPAADYRLVRSEADAIAVTDSRWLSVPWLYADFDLHMDVELGEAMDLDVLLRQVEPRIVRPRAAEPDGDGSTWLPFHGRFTVLRLSTRGAGEPWLSRDAALCGERRGGAELAPGLLATVWVQARGRMLRANVAGKWLPWFAAADVFGSLTVVAHGGRAAVRSLVIQGKGLPDGWLLRRWTWIALGVLAGAAVAVAVWRRRPGPVRTVATGIGMVLLVGTVTRTQFALDQWIVPELGGLFVLLGGSAALGTCVLCVRGWRDVPWLLLPLGALAALWGTYRGEHRTDNRAVDELFGAPSNEALLSEALAQRVRGPFEIHDVAKAGHRVFLLGGQLLYHRREPEQHLEPLLAGDLRVALRQRVDVPCMPTLDGHTAQQWRLFARFFAGHEPDVIVFGVPRGETADDPATGRPRSSAATVAATLQQAREHCRARGCRLVVFADVQLPPDVLAVLTAAEKDGVPLVVAHDGEEPASLSQRLTAVIAPLLR